MLTLESTVTIDRILVMHYMRLENAITAMSQTIARWRRVNYEDIAKVGQELYKHVSDAKEGMVRDLCFLSGNPINYSEVVQLVEQTEHAKTSQALVKEVLNMLREHMKKNNDEMEAILAGTCKRH